MTYEYVHGLHVNHALDKNSCACFLDGRMTVIVKHLVFCTRFIHIYECFHVLFIESKGESISSTEVSNKIQYRRVHAGSSAPRDKPKQALLTADCSLRLLI